MTNIKCVGEISIFFVFVSLVSLYLALISYNEYILPCYKTFPGRPTSTYCDGLAWYISFQWNFDLFRDAHQYLLLWMLSLNWKSVFIVLKDAYVSEVYVLLLYTFWTHDVCILNTQTYMHKNKIHDTSMYI